MTHKESLTIEVIARGVWIVGQQILLCRNRRAGHLFLPGGHVEPGEPAAAALAREFVEETGLNVQVGPFLGGVEASFLQAPAPKPGRDPRPPQHHHEISLLFQVTMPPPTAAAPGTPGTPSSPASPGTPVAPAASAPLPVPSLEEKLEFVWIALADLQGPTPRARLLPPAALPIVLASAPGSILGAAPSGGPGHAAPAWITSWE